MERRPDASRHASVEPASDRWRDTCGPPVPRRARSRTSRRRGRTYRGDRSRCAVRTPPVARRCGRVRRRSRAYARRVSVPIAAPVKRNAFLLAGGLICNSGMFQLAAALSSLTLVAVTGVTGILGLGPAIFLASGAIVVGPAGRFMDRVGRMPVIRVGYAFGAAGCGIVAGGCALSSAALVAVGSACSAAPARRSSSRALRPRRCFRRIVARAACRSFSSAPCRARCGARSCSGRSSPIGAIDAQGLVGPWLVGIPFMIVGLGIVSFVRPDPKEIAASYPEERVEPYDRRPAPRDAAPAGRSGCGARGRGELRGHGERHEPRGLRRRRARAPRRAMCSR